MCSVCGKGYSQKDKLKRHVTKQHEGIKKVFNCSECDVSFSIKEHLTVHFVLNHEVKTEIVEQDGQENLDPLQLCEVTFDQPDAHLITHQDSNEVIIGLIKCHFTKLQWI